jgi:hypothetical protein
MLKLTVKEGNPVFSLCTLKTFKKLVVDVMDIHGSLLLRYY